MANEFIARNGFRSQNNSDITGSLNVTAGITGSFTGSLTGIATTASYVNPLVQNVLVTGSLTVSSSNANQFQVGSNLVYVSSSGNVGIGTTSPSYLLDVNGTAKIQKDGVGTYSLYTTKNISGSTGAYNATSLNSMAVTSTGTGGYQSAALKNYLIINQNSTYNYTFGHEWSAMTNELNISSYGGVTAGADRIANTVIKSVIGYNRSITDTLIDLYFLYENYGTVGTHWGIFHGSTDAKHYFGGKMMIGTSTDINYKFRVLGSSSFSGNVDITGSASNSLRVKGSGATNATNAVLVENSSGVATFSVDDSGVTRMGPSGSEYMIVKNTLNVGINNSTPTAFLHVRSNQTNGSTFVFLAQNQDAVTFSGNNGGIGTIMAIKDNYTVVITGSTTITGSLVITGSTTSTLGFTGSLQGTAATSSATTLTSSYVGFGNSSNLMTGSSNFYYQDQTSYKRLFITSPNGSSNSVSIYCDNNTPLIQGYSNFVVDSAYGELFLISTSGTGINMYVGSGTNTFAARLEKNNGLKLGGYNSFTTANAANYFTVDGGNSMFGTNSATSARVEIRGSGTTSATTTFLVQNSTPTKILEIKDDQSIGFFGVTPSTRPTTGITGAATGGGGGVPIDDATTYGGYTMGQVVAALQQLGLLT